MTPDLDRTIAGLSEACWQVLAYDQLLRSVTSTDMLFAGDMPSVDAAYDAMIRAVTNALAACPPTLAGDE